MRVWALVRDVLHRQTRGRERREEEAPILQIAFWFTRADTSAALSLRSL